MIVAEHVYAALRRIRPYLVQSPLIRAHEIERLIGCRVSLKLENLQPTGAFKVRGAFNSILSLDENQRQRGVIVASGGNHAKAIAYAAQRLGVHAVVCMSRHAPRASQDYCASLGAAVELTDTHPEAFTRAAALASMHGSHLIHPFADPAVMAGQGTIALEVLEQVPDVTDLVVSVGGGGLLSGMTVATRALKPTVRMWGVETEGANTMERSLMAGKPAQLERIDSIAWSLGAPTVSTFALELTQHSLHKLQIVTDQECRDALRTLFEDCKLLVEPAASCTLAALRHMRASLDDSAHVVLVLCSGNVTMDEVNRWLA